MEELDFIEELLNLFAVDRLAEVYVKDEEYQKRLKEEDLIYQKLSEELPDKKAKELECYFEAISFTEARKEALTYIQGMKDLFALLKALTKN